MSGVSRRLALRLGAGAAASAAATVAPSRAWAEEGEDEMHHARGVVTPVMITEQASNRLMVMDVRRPWSDPRAVLWTWQASERNGISDPATSWGLPDDGRLRRGADGQQYVLTTDSYGLLAKIPFPRGGEVAWSVELGHGPNPHGIELLPDGNVAVAASTGKFVRIYTASQGRHSDHYVEDALSGAHEVYWDDAMQVLWAIADHEVIGYSVGGTAAEPTLERSHSLALPTNWGHDLHPVPGQPDRLWATTVYGVHQMEKSTGAHHEDFERAYDLYNVNVKSIGTDARSGAVLETQPTTGNALSWATDQVKFFVGRRGSFTRTLPGASIYRARWFREDSN